MFVFADVLDLFAHKFAGLSTGDLPSAFILRRAFQSFFFRHHCSFRYSASSELISSKLKVCTGRLKHKMPFLIEGKFRLVRTQPHQHRHFGCTTSG
jgi:hypothetical protein